MCSDGILSIIGDAEKKRHDKNVSDSRASITVVRCGRAAGEKGPIIFLLKGTNSERNRIFTKKRLAEKYNLPEGSCVLMNENAYMDDETWLVTVKEIAPVLRRLPVIRDHPDW